MKSIKKLFAMLGVMLAMSVVVMPLAGWTSAASADEAETAIQTAAIGGVQPLFGGSKQKTFEFPTDQIDSNGKRVTLDVNVTVSAGNWIWPSADGAVVTITSPSEKTYFGFEVKFVWTNDVGKYTYWRVPGQLDVGIGENLQILDRDDSGNYYTRLVKNCNASGLSGNPGQKWACDHILVICYVRIVGYELQSYTFDPVYF